MSTIIKKNKLKLFSVVSAVFMASSLPLAGAYAAKTTEAAAAKPAAVKVQGTPHEMVQRTADGLVNALNSNPERFKTNPALYEKVVRDTLVPSIDFVTIAKRVMGKKYYTKATKEQRAKFIAAFKESMITTYSTGLEVFDNQEITVLPANPENAGKKVQAVDMEVKTADGTIFPLRFSTRLGKDGKWRVVNVVINGVNVGKAYRNHFSESINKVAGDMDKVIAEWNADIVSDVQDK